MPTLQAFWNKLNANEKLVGYGAIVVAIAFLLGLVGGSFGYGSTDLIAAIVILVIYWLKYSPNPIAWPAPVQTIVLIIAGISAILALLGLLPVLGFFSLGLYFIAAILNLIGCALMAYGAWKEYQVMPKTAPPASPTPPAPPLASPPPASPPPPPPPPTSPTPPAPPAPPAV
jgi:hypothetical protein